MKNSRIKTVGYKGRELQVLSSADGVGQGRAVRVFQVSSHRDAPGNPGYLDPEGQDLLLQVEGCGVSFDNGVRGQEDLFDRPGLESLEQFLDIDFVRADTIQRGDHAMEDVVLPVEGAGLLDGVQIVRLFHDADDLFGPAGILAEAAGILVGAGIGVIIGFISIWFFKKYHIRDTMKVIIFMIVAVIFYDTAELPAIKNFIPIAALLGVMAIGFILLEKYDVLANRMAAKFNKIWVLAEILLFVYIGTEVQISKIATAETGWS